MTYFSGIYCKNSIYIEIVSFRFMDKRYSVNLNSRLGEGGNGTVYARFRRNDAKLVAVKHIDKKTVNWLHFHDGKKVPMGIYVMTKLSKVKGIMKLIDYFETSKSFYIIMERLENVMDLFDYITKNGALSDNIAKDFFRQI